jgi:hypothetical protein
MYEKDVSASAVEQGRQNLSGRVRAVLSKDAFVGDPTGDYDSGFV